MRPEHGVATIHGRAVFFLPPLDHGVESGGFWLRLVLHAAVEIAGVEGQGGRTVNCSCGAVPGLVPELPLIFNNLYPNRHRR